jgi:hypothetical protein
MEQRFPWLTPVVRILLFVVFIGGAIVLRDQVGLSSWVTFPVAVALLVAADHIVGDLLRLPDPFDQPAVSDRVNAP